ncbi:REXO1-like protein [Mya arenaria]|uniref:REXO1-like protein n=1 Tax=Mya arenaria TaxID=6604 RepID=A0ABY7FVJ4_MYAAR|nr:REXO1-like protein [Mya arenaria]
MFKNTGLFKDVPCPYFLFGLCERPYCHFRHSKHEEAKARIEVEKLSNLYKEADENETAPQPASSLQRTLIDIENSIKNEKKIIENHDKPEPTEPTKVVAKLKNNKPTGTPEYNPTPLTELKEKQSKGELKSGRSKYDLALLDEPETDSEYDPACNYSTKFSSVSYSHNSVTHQESDRLPEYAQSLGAGIKRKSETDENDDSQLAKIPKFMSVSYTPALNESTELSEEEPIGQPEDWFSDEQSDKDSLIGVQHNSADDKVSNPATSNKIDTKKTDKENAQNILPIEFNKDGSVKYLSDITSEKSASDNKKPKPKSQQKEKKVVHNESVTDDNETEIPDKGGGNIFNLFKAEFDSALETCADDETTDIGIEDKKHKVKHKSGSDKTKAIEKSESSKKVTEKHNVKPRSDKVSELSNDRKRNHSSDKNKSSVKNGVHKPDLSPLKHKHSSSGTERHKHLQNMEDTSDKPSHEHANHKQTKHKHSLSSTPGSKHRSSSGDKVSSSQEKLSSSGVKHSSSSQKHGPTYKHRHSSSDHHKPLSSNDKHSSSNSVKTHSSSDKHNSSRSNSEKAHSNKDKNTSVSSQQKNRSVSAKHTSSSLPKQSHKISSSSEKSSKLKLSKTERHRSGEKSPRAGTSSNKIHKDRDGSRAHSSSSNKSSGSKSTPDRVRQHSSSSKKKNILNLDVDLFGDVNNHGGAAGELSDYDSDLEKYFTDEDPFDECLRIFNEEPRKSHTAGASDRKKLKRPAPEDPEPPPEEQHKEKVKVKVKQIQQKNREKAVNSTAPPKPSLASASATFTTYMANKNKKTSATTVGKGVKRTAHAPTIPIAKLKRPTVEVNTSSKVATNVRQRYLNMFIDEFLKTCANEEEAYNKGKAEEQAVFKRCSNKNVYLNIAVNTIKRLRTAVLEGSGKKTGHVTQVKMSHASMLDGSGPGASKATYTVNRSGGGVKIREEDFEGVELYRRLKPYILTEEQLRENNFPRPDPEKGGSAVFYGEQQYTQKAALKGYEKLCVRCGKVFEVYPNGKYPVKQECVYHWGKAWKKKIAGAIDTRYTCCQGDLASEGCQVAKTETMSGFMKTIPASPAIDGDYGVYALDCEMLARVTVVGPDQEPAYESLVLPDNRIVDLNTRFSGISEDDMEDVTTTIRDVQAVLLSLFSDQTILMGHSLESDLMALKMIHNTVVDTSVVFPHRMGRPFKRALRNLMVEYLKKIIQDDGTVASR